MARTGRPRTALFYRADQGYLAIRIGKGKQAIKKYVHVFIAERALGKPLPKGAQVHHVNEIPDYNTNTNLVICQDQAYHDLLHIRTAAFRATGDPHKRRCPYCGQYDDVANLRVMHRTNKLPSGSGTYTTTTYTHRRCIADSRLKGPRKRPYKECPSRWLKQAEA